MAFIVIAIISFTLAMAAPEPPRVQKSFSRQTQPLDAAAPSAPYPPANVTPEIPFNLPTETEAPVGESNQIYGPPEPKPDETYGPPEPIPDQSYGPPKPTPDQTYGPPNDEDFPAISEPDNAYGPPKTNIGAGFKEPDAEELPPSQSNIVSESLIQHRNGKIRSGSRSDRLRSLSSIRRS